MPPLSLLVLSYICRSLVGKTTAHVGHRLQLLRTAGICYVIFVQCLAVVFQAILLLCLAAVVFQGGWVVGAPALRSALLGQETLLAACIACAWPRC